MATRVLLAASLLVLLSLLPSSASAQCNKVYTVQTKQYNYTQCVTTPQGYNFAWVLYDNLFGAVVVCKPYRSGGWCGWGLSTDGKMIGANSMVAFANPDNPAQVKLAPFYLQGFAPKDVLINQGFEVKESEVEVSSDGMVYTLRFVIKLPSNNLPAYYIVGSGFGTSNYEQGILLGHPGNGAWVQQVEFSTGISTTTIPYSYQKKVHAILATVGFGILMPLGLLVSRHLKLFADPAWFYTHIFTQLSGYILGSVAFGYGIQLKYWTKRTRNPHYALGISVAVLATLQILGTILKPDKESKIRLVWNLFHWTVGYATVIIGIVNIYEGFEIQEYVEGYEGWRKAYSIFLIVYVIIFVLLEVGTWALWLIRRKKKNEEEQDDLNKP